MKRATLTILAVVFGLLALHILLSLINVALLQPRHAGAPDALPGITKLTGAMHIHSRHSDGSGYLANIASAGREAGLDFLLISDHNSLALKDSVDAVASPLLLVGAELSLTPKHVLAYGLPALYEEEAAGGVPGILDSVKAHDGFAFVAHPYHPKIYWRGEWYPEFTGIEILNADVEWRNDPFLEMLGAICAVPLFAHAMNLLIDLPVRELRLWDDLSKQRPTVGIGSVDAHARIKLSKTSFWKFPSYAKTFSLIQNVILFRGTVPDRPDSMRRSIVEAIQRGHVVFGYSGLGDLRQADIWLTSGGRVFLPGDEITFRSDETQSIHVTLPAGVACETMLYRDGLRIKSSTSDDIHWSLTQPGVYRVLVSQKRLHVPQFTRINLPWIFANPFYVQEQ